MRELIEYACVVLHAGTDLGELEMHLSVNGYNFGITCLKLVLHICTTTELLTMIVI